MNIDPCMGIAEIFGRPPLGLRLAGATGLTLALAGCTLPAAGTQPEGLYGEIDVVNYNPDVTPEINEQIAERVRIMLSQATGGIADYEVKPMQASDEARKALADATKAKGCTDERKEDQFASVIALNIMNLGNAALVLAISSRDGCSKQRGVLAPNGKIAADVFPLAVKDTNKKEGVVDDVAIVVSHEAGHALLHLGHGGTLSGGSLTDVYIKGTFDLAKDLKKCTYDENGAGAYGDMMSRDVLGRQIVPNPIHRNAVLKEAGKGPEELLAHSITKDWASIDLDGITAGKFFEIPMEKSVTYKDDVSLGGKLDLAAKRTFTTMAFVPRWNDMHGVFFQIILYDKDFNTASLGEIYNEETGKDASMRIKYNDQEFDIVVKGSTLSAKKS